ncbi:hypothetical protein C2845_PM17G06550 [Panicum miliaceum]|uniref:Uncharacterized protein n=1 Tax=Panicum miliaceum TaxID=4540 RepID=A0A3L6Q1R0_PANMI|nr:hypothetical protein C2845_PM17G06550 [Panicum miliaceum]
MAEEMERVLILFTGHPMERHDNVKGSLTTKGPCKFKEIVVRLDHVGSAGSITIFLSGSCAGETPGCAGTPIIEALSKIMESHVRLHPTTFGRITLLHRSCRVTTKMSPTTYHPTHRPRMSSWSTRPGIMSWTSKFKSDVKKAMHIRFKSRSDSGSQTPTHVSDRMSIDSIPQAGEGITGKYWEKISGQDNSRACKTNDIHNPTLRFMHRWIGTTLHPRSDPGPISTNELLILNAMVKKIKFSPVKTMADHWSSTPNRVGFIGITSLVTQIACAFDLLEGATVTFLEQERPTITAEHFVQGHMLHVAVDGSLIMIYRGYTTEVPLPCTRLELYAIKRLTLSLEEGRPPRHSVSGAGPTTRREPTRHIVSGAGPTMRARTRRREETAEPSSPQPPPPETLATAASQEAYSGGWHAGSYGSGYAEGADEAGPSHQQFGADPGTTQSDHYPPSYYENFSHVVETTDDTNARVRQIETRLDEHKNLMDHFFGSWDPY